MSSRNSLPNPCFTNMDIDLPDTILQDWVQRLDRHFKDLRDRFGPDST